MLFNPFSIANILKSDHEYWDKNRVVERDGKYVHLDAHSKVAGENESEVISKLHSITDDLSQGLKTASHLFLTLGTAWVYERDARVVANCHKQHPENFSRRLLGIDEILDALSPAISGIINENPALKIYITVSPIRHIKDGLIQNNRSKARLLEVAHRITEVFGNVNYLPAYELVMDELRDYRFYNDDLIHPSKAAVNYILDYFMDHFFSAKTAEIYLRYEKLLKLQGHRQLLSDPKRAEKVKQVEEEILRLKST